MIVFLSCQFFAISQLTINIIRCIIDVVGFIISCRAFQTEAHIFVTQSEARFFWSYWVYKGGELSEKL